MTGSNLIYAHPSRRDRAGLKVLHIIDSGGLYGAEIMLLNLVDEQLKAGMAPTIASIGSRSAQEKPLETAARERGFQVKKFRMKPGPNLAGTFGILRYAFAEGFEIMHSHGYKGNILFGLMPASMRRLPLVATLHGWTATAGFSKKKLYEWLDAWSLRYIDAVVPVSRHMLEHPKLRNRRGINFRVVNNGIPPTAGRPAGSISSLQDLGDDRDRSIVDFCRRQYTIGSIGRLSKEKGFADLLEALRILVAAGIDAAAVIVGEGPQRANLEKLISKTGLAGRVLLPGYRQDARRFIPFFDVFVLASLTEGLPITLLEAMQARVPVVATRVGGIPELLDNARAGLMASPAKPAEIAQNIGRLYRNANLANRLSRAAFERVTGVYSSVKMAAQYLDIYKSLLPGTDAPRSGANQMGRQFGQP
jgi:glycosyltransferase involved in cell wall biosynthesis